MSQFKPLPSSITTALIKFEQEVRHATKHNTHENDLAADKACSKLMEAIRKELEPRNISTLRLAIEEFIRLAPSFEGDEELARTIGKSVANLR